MKKNNRKIRFSGYLRLALLVVVPLASAFAPIPAVNAQPAQAFSQISFVPNIETTGVVVSGSSLPLSAQLYYRRSGEVNWRLAHDLVRIKDGRLIGSLFNLAQNTTYEARVSDGVSEITGAFTTQADQLVFAPSTTMYVNAAAPAGGDGSASAPFNTIQEGVNHAMPGTQVLVADGVYTEAVTFPASGMPGSWIQVKAQGGAAVLDGSISVSKDDWIPYEGKNKVWYTNVSPIKYLARNEKRFYQYDFLPDLINQTGHDDSAVTEGWFYDPAKGRLYVRTNREPFRYTWNVPRYNSAFQVEGRDWIWIEGFEMRYYGTSYGCGVCSTNSSHVVIRGNKIHNIQNPVFVSWTGGEDRGNDTRIEYNEMYDPTDGVWTWGMVKGTSMESMAIVLRGHIGAIVRGNTIHDYYNGIYTSSSAALDNPGVAFDVDIYDNRIYSIGDDAFEPEGTCVNHRFRDNWVNSTLVGISLAPISMGPAWVMNNVFANYTGRSIKWDKNSDGWTMVYHNTSWTNYAVPNSVQLISPIQNTIMRNNIFQGSGYAIEARLKGALNNDWNYDNWVTSSTNSRFQWESVGYYTINQLCQGAGLECNGHEALPGFVNPFGGDFTLSASSPNIDRGVLIPGINDSFFGAAPDLGAFESAFGIVSTNTPEPSAPTPTPVLVPTETPTPIALPTVPLAASLTRLEPSPNNFDLVRFALIFSEDVSGLDVEDFVLTATGGISNYSIAEISGAASEYIVTVYTGTGDGTLQLTLADNDSVINGMSMPLGGVGIGNGTLIGEVYVINKYAPFVTSVLRADPSPSSAESVRYLVTFSEPVTGVDAADFVLSTSGLSEAGVSSVTGFDNNYAVLVQTGEGSGSIRLDVLNDGSVVDAAGASLNGGFTLGEMYEVKRNTPAAQSVTFYSDGKNDGWILESKENSNKGGTANSKDAIIRLGDNAQNNQYRSILSFQTESLPDQAVVTRMILSIQSAGLVGGNPFDTHRTIWVDIRQGAFGSFGPFQIGALQNSDFQAPASLYSAGVIENNPVGDWYWVNFDAKVFPHLNLKGATQFRLGFLLDDDNDRHEDYISFFSGDYGVTTARPQLTVEYYVP